MLEAMVESMASKLCRCNESEVGSQDRPIEIDSDEEGVEYFEATVAQEGSGNSQVGYFSRSQE
jgi:hypothetical protein